MESVVNIRAQLVCPAGHTGPFVYVETRELRYRVLDTTASYTAVNEDFDVSPRDVVPLHPHFECAFEVARGELCGHTFPLPPTASPEHPNRILITDHLQESE